MVNLPEIVEIHDFDAALRIYQWLEAIEWRWDINTLLEQPDALMSDVAEIASIMSKFDKIREARKKEAKTNDRAGRYGSVV